MLVLDEASLQNVMFWLAGSVAGKSAEGLVPVLPYMLIAGAAALALGDDAGRALGAHIGRTRIVGAVAITLLCGAATAAIGPIVFVGLTVPHIARAITGPDQRWVFAYSAVLAPVLLLGADVIGRLVARPGELQVGIVTAFIGAPVFIALVRRKRIAQL
jgi:iron complex transport system permease protein